MRQERYTRAADVDSCQSEDVHSKKDLMPSVLTLYESEKCDLNAKPMQKLHCTTPKNAPRSEPTFP